MYNFCKFYVLRFEVCKTESDYCKEEVKKHQLEIEKLLKYSEQHIQIVDEENEHLQV